MKVQRIGGFDGFIFGERAIGNWKMKVQRIDGFYGLILGNGQLENESTAD